MHIKVWLLGIPLGTLGVWVPIRGLHASLLALARGTEQRTNEIPSFSPCGRTTTCCSLLALWCHWRFAKIPRSPDYR
ncbi:hypothetical protein QBC45DRAFT_419247 [Copromyces sp. CBS 386.78]|nr:hypothetical protein QBC45DRAFT_419247 [Copromyces sp. CBS 386.78]